MAKEKLTVVEVSNAGPGKYCDGGNLWLFVSESLARKWVLRFRWQGRQKEMGLGSAKTVGLREARNKAVDAMRLIARGVNPMNERNLIRAKKVPTFGEMAEEYLAMITPTFRNEKHKAQWRSTLLTYATHLWPRAVDTIGTNDILGVLRPIWAEKSETASRLRGRIERVLNFAKTANFFEGENPARWKGHLSNALPKPRKLTRGHHPAMPYEEIAEFLVHLRKKGANGHLALEFCILTALRTGAVVCAQWAEIDLEKKIWVVPADQMKTKREHRVPLSGRVIAILKTMQLRNFDGNEFVFPGQKPGRHISEGTMDRVLDRMDVEFSVHGFRSSFRDWAGDETIHSREVIEAALAHKVGNDTELSYRRRDALEKRRALMEDWANYCEWREPATVIPLKVVSG